MIHGMGCAMELGYEQKLHTVTDDGTRATDMAVCRIRISEQELETGADKLYTRVGIRARNRSCVVCIYKSYYKRRRQELGQDQKTEVAYRNWGKSSRLYSCILEPG